MAKAVSYAYDPKTSNLIAVMTKKDETPEAATARVAAVHGLEIAAFKSKISELAPNPAFNELAEIEDGGTVKSMRVVSSSRVKEATQRRDDRDLQDATTALDKMYGRRTERRVESGLGSFKPTPDLTMEVKSDSIPKPR